MERLQPVVLYAYECILGSAEYPTLRFIVRVSLTRAASKASDNTGELSDA